MDIRKALRATGLGLLWGLVLVVRAHAGGSGLNTVLVVNQDSANSLALGNYYAEKRAIPPENILRLHWTGVNTTWSYENCTNLLLNPLLDLVHGRGLSNQLYIVVLSMDIPFQTVDGSSINSTTSILYYGFKHESGLEFLAVTNSYAGTELPFEFNRPKSAPTNSFLAAILTSDTLDLAKKLVDNGVASDSSFPTQPVFLAKSTDTRRNVRYPYFDNAAFNVRLAGGPPILRTNTDTIPAGPLLGFETGLGNWWAAPSTFVPGALADSLTSYAGLILGPNGQSSALVFLNAGAIASYGTVTEPTPAIDKFPSPNIYFYQRRGFNAAECYYQAVNAPYEGLVVGEPLAAPFARRASASISGITPGETVSGARTLSFSFEAADSAHPIQQVDLFLDGRYWRTVTNIFPSTGNQFTLNLNKATLQYSVPSQTTVPAMTADLAGLVTTGPTNIRTQPLAVGDRLELRSTSTNRPAPVFNLRAAGSGGLGISNSVANIGTAISALGTAPALTTYLVSSRDGFLDSNVYGNRLCTFNGTLQIGSWVTLTVTKTNRTTVKVALTNQSSSATVVSFFGQFFTNIVNTAALQGSDGIAAEDFAEGFLGAAQFNLRARSPGLNASNIRIAFTNSGSFVINPPTNCALQGNLGDLQPRNHAYVCVGLTNLNCAFPFDTSSIDDGYHEVTAVAYEGTSVRAQTHVKTSFVVSNSAWGAVLASPDLQDGSPASGTYHLHVETTGGGQVNNIRLFTTGGEVGEVSGQSSGDFTVDARVLGAGLHPFYAIVEGPGRNYRTQTLWFRLQ